MNRFHSIKILLQLYFSLFILTGCTEQPDIIKDSNLPGKHGDYTLLSNGWKLTPAGDNITIGELPLNMVVTKDERFAITSNSGTDDNSISVIDLQKKAEIQKVKIAKSWRGLCFNDDESILFVSGGNDDNIRLFNFNNGSLEFKDTLSLKVYGKDGVSVSGIAFWQAKNYILAVSKGSNSLFALDLKSGKVVKTIKLNSECYDVIIDHSQKFAYVSLWGSSQIAKINLGSLEMESLIKTGDHPCEMIITKDDKYLFGANANNNSTSVIDLDKNREIEKIISSLKPDVPFGSTPNALSLNEDETILMIANADNNYLALFDIHSIMNPKCLGFIPVGWYPTSVKYLHRHKQILVANGKGLTSLPNPDGPKPGVNQENTIEQYIGSLFKGTLSIINYPDTTQLNEYSSKVYSNTPYYSKAKPTISQSAIPVDHDGIGSTKIKHVFYIIKENRSYDQVFGDISEGNGDSTLCLFNQHITPNMHKLAKEFTLFDNFYVDAEVSADGHNWSTAAYATDYVEKTWPTYYGGRGGSYDFEGDKEISSPSSGYIWDKVIDKGISYRNYGEFVNDKYPVTHSYLPPLKKLVPYTHSLYPGWDLTIKDMYRFKIWEEDFNRLASNDSLPAFETIRLPNDHTAGTDKDNYTINAMIADNDYAVGSIVNTISKSMFWNESIIFVLEDDAQNGSDHVDAHRSPVLVISPYIKHGFVDHTMYSTSSILKTIELILGLNPMTQYDLSATPIINAISNTPDLSPYDVIKPNVNTDEMNTADLYKSERCGEFDFTKEDAIPDIEFNEIIWKAIRGANSEMPVPVRSAFVRVQ